MANKRTRDEAFVAHEPEAFCEIRRAMYNLASRPTNTSCMLLYDACYKAFYERELEDVPAHLSEAYLQAMAAMELKAGWPAFSKGQHQVVKVLRFIYNMRGLKIDEEELKHRAGRQFLARRRRRVLGLNLPDELMAVVSDSMLVEGVC